MTLLAALGEEEQYVDELLRHYASRIDDARDFALKRRVMLLKTDDNTDIDVALGGLPFEKRAVGRATDFEFYPGMTLRTCSAEDLMVMKAFAGREQDWADLKGIIARQESLNWRLVSSELRPLCELKEAPGIPKRLEKLRKEVSGK